MFITALRINNSISCLACRAGRALAPFGSMTVKPRLVEKEYVQTVFLYLINQLR